MDKKQEQWQEFQKLKVEMDNLLIHCIGSSFENFGMNTDNIANHHLEELREALSYIRCGAEYLPRFEEYFVNLTKNSRDTL